MAELAALSELLTTAAGAAGAQFSAGLAEKGVTVARLRAGAVEDAMLKTLPIGIRAKLRTELARLATGGAPSASATGNSFAALAPPPSTPPRGGSRTAAPPSAASSDLLAMRQRMAALEVRLSPVRAPGPPQPLSGSLAPLTAGSPLVSKAAASPTPVRDTSRAEAQLLRREQDLELREQLAAQREAGSEAEAQRLAQLQQAVADGRSAHAAGDSAALKAQLVEAREEAESLRRLLSQNGADLDFAESECRIAKQQAGAAQARAQELEEQAGQIEQQAQELTATGQAAEAERAELQAKEQRLVESAARMKQVRQQHEEDQAALQAGEEAVAAREAQVQVQVQSIEQQMQVLESGGSAEAVRITQLESEAAARDADAAQLRREVEELDQRDAAGAAEADAMQRELQQYRVEMAAHEAEVAELHATNEQLALAERAARSSGSQAATPVGPPAAAGGYDASEHRAHVSEIAALKAQAREHSAALAQAQRAQSQPRQARQVSGGAGAAGAREAELDQREQGLDAFAHKLQTMAAVMTGQSAPRQKKKPVANAKVGTAEWKAEMQAMYKSDGVAVVDEQKKHALQRKAALEKSRVERDAAFKAKMVR